jgi:capsular exopolysaccharide synthesis family protein
MERTLTKHRLADIEGLPNRGDAEASAGLTRPARTAPAKGRAGRIDSRLVCLLKPASAAAERFNRLRHAIEAMRPPDRALTVGVTSPSEADGKTLTAINLAGALARGSDERVLLIDADLRRPSVARQLGMTDAHLGLADALSDDRTSVADVVRRLDAHNLDVIPAGTLRTDISQILRSPRLDAFLTEARQRYVYIVLDTPPLLPVFDSALLAKSVDGVLMVVSANRTPRKLLGEALNMLDASAVLGIVFNRDERPLFGYYNAYQAEYFPDLSRAATEA